MATSERPHCVVIGVGAGTGLACVKKFLAEGYKVSMIARNPKRLAGFADELENATAYPSDIAEPEAYRTTLQQIAGDEGAPEIVIFNASLATFATYDTLDPADLERNFRVNTSGLLIAAQEFAPAMCERGDGALVVTGNTGSLRGIPSFVGFSPTKASQRIMAECLARELGPKGVHVAYVIIDAAIDMPFARRRFGEDKPDDFFAQPTNIAAEIYHIAHQPRSTRTFEIQIRPFGEKW